MQMLKRNLKRRSTSLPLPDGFIPFPFQKFRSVPRPPSITPLNFAPKVKGVSVPNLKKNEIAKSKYIEIRDDFQPLIKSKFSPSLSERQKKVLSEVITEIERIDPMHEFEYDITKKTNAGKVSGGSSMPKTLNLEEQSSTQNNFKSSFEITDEERKSLQSAFLLAEQEERERQGDVIGPTPLSNANHEFTFDPKERQSIYPANAITNYMNTREASIAPRPPGIMPDINYLRSLAESNQDYVLYGISEDEIGVKCIGLPGEAGKLAEVLIEYIQMFCNEKDLNVDFNF